MSNEIEIKAAADDDQFRNQSHIGGPNDRPGEGGGENDPGEEQEVPAEEVPQEEVVEEEAASGA